MVRVLVIVEGETEASFIAGLLYSSLLPYGVFVHPIVLGVSGHRGGRVNYPRVKKDILRTLKQDRSAYCSTLFDLYGLGDSFPAAPQLMHLQGIARVNRLEQALLQDVLREAPELRPEIRFIPYIQLYEFEALLFSDPAALARGMFHPELEPKLHAVRNNFSTPEDINDSPETAPSKRVLALDGGYDKVISGILAAEHMGIEVIKRNCPRFCSWFEKLASLGSSTRS